MKQQDPPDLQLKVYGIFQFSDRRQLIKNMDLLLKTLSPEKMYKFQYLDGTEP